MATQHLQSPTMRVDRDTYASVRSLAGQLQLPMQSVLAKAVEHYRRHLLVEEANAAYTRLREDPLAVREMEEERRIFENTLSDGLRNDPYEL
jgi:hypothetical protein